MPEPVLFDLPGWGEATVADGAHSIDAIGQLVRDTLLELGYTKWDIVGHSLGGFLALHFAALWPQHVTSVAMVSGTTWSVIEPRFGELPGFVSLWRVMQGLAGLGRAGRALVRGMLLPHARTLTVADCGHFAKVERPEAVLELLSR